MGNYKDEHEVNGVSHYAIYSIDELLVILESKLKGMYKEVKEITEAINKKLEAEQKGEIL